MTLVIVDDEVFIVEMMKAIIDWEGLGLVLAGTAYDGMEACKLIEAEKPDIVITDIRLPGIDGLGVIRTCYMREDHCRFIVISGYRQFEYAQTAMSYCIDCVIFS
jgi:two-component system response regulator YesN